MKIEKVVAGGYGLAHEDNATYFVRGAVVGDEVVVKVVHKRSGVFIAEVERFVQRSKQRSAGCPYSECGGCIWSGVSYSAQLGYKCDILREVFAQDVPMLASEPYLHYRNKVVLPVDSQGRLGVYKPRTHEVQEVQGCCLHPEVFDRVQALLRGYLQKSGLQPYDQRTGKGSLRYLGIRISSKDEIVLVLVTKLKKLPFSKVLVREAQKVLPNLAGIVQNINRSEGNKIFGQEQKLIWGRDWVEEQIGDFNYRCSYYSFFQINRFQVKNLYDKIFREIADGDVVLDAYSGVSSIGIYISAKAKEVWCIEENAQAVENAKANLELNAVENVRLVCGKVEHEFAKMPKVDTIIFDPPRVGLDRKLIEAVLSSSVQKIVYVSCNPAMQKRDVDLLIAGGFALQSLQGVDMFPCTAHIECVAVLTK